MIFENIVQVTYTPEASIILKDNGTVIGPVSSQMMELGTSIASIRNIGIIETVPVGC
jgi:hypothetical protein